MNRILKKTICVLLCAAMAFGAILPAFAAGYALGDVDGNGKVETKDARLALRAAVGLETLSEKATAAADVDGSGKTGTDDARTILRVAVGLMRLSRDGKRFEDIPTAGELLKAYLLQEGEYAAEGDCTGYGYEFEDGGLVSFYYYNGDELPFEVYCYQPGEGFAVECAIRFNRFFTRFEAVGFVFDDETLYAHGEYTVTDTENLNTNTGASCFTETAFEGEPDLKKELPQAMTMLLCAGFQLLLNDLKTADVPVTKEDMRLNRVTEAPMTH